MTPVIPLVARSNASSLSGALAFTVVPVLEAVRWLERHGERGGVTMTGVIPACPSVGG